MGNKEMRNLSSPEHGIYNIEDFKTYDIVIDFNNPKSVINEMVNIVNDVENECPVGKAFGFEGIGEGVVWVLETEKNLMRFKTKGKKHQSSKTKTLIPVDIERVNNIKEMVSNFVTEARLNQGIEQLRMENLELTRRNVGPFLKWIVSDIIKEELDTIMGNGFEPKEIQGQISKVARDWFFKMEMENINL